MTLEQKVGQVFMLGFEGTTLNASNRALIQGWHLGGVTLFARNIESGLQLTRLNADLQTVADPVPLFISVDQEGGLVVRVTNGATIFPGNMAVGAAATSTWRAGWLRPPRASCAAWASTWTWRRCWTSTPIR